MVRAKNRKTNQKRSYGQSSFADNYTKPAEELRHPDEDDADRLQHSSPTGPRSKRTRRSSSSAESHALTHADQFSPEMIKYWKQRYWLFSLFDGSSPTGQLPLLDAESWFSVTPEPIAARIAQRCRSGTVLDAFCGAGGNAIQFALTCERVIAIDVDEVKLRMARHNARVYGVESYITFLRGDWRRFASDWLLAHSRGRSVEQATPYGGEEDKTEVSGDEAARWQESARADIDVVFLSPPWGGVNYRALSTPAKDAVPVVEDVVEEDEYYPLEALAPDGGKKLLSLARSITPNVCLYVPTSTDLAEIAMLAKTNGAANDEATAVPAFDVDVEEQWLNGRCKALSCYFGELAEWKEDEETEVAHT